jgi:hypothetical protein
VGQVGEQGIKWLLVMALDPDGLDAARALEDKGIELHVKWVTIAPGGKFFLPSMGARGAEFFMVRRRPRVGGAAAEVDRDWGRVRCVDSDNPCHCVLSSTHCETSAVTQIESKALPCRNCCSLPDKNPACNCGQVPAQWDASLITSDAVFKTNANYVSEFNSSAAYIPTYNAASGSATVMAL